MNIKIVNKPLQSKQDENLEHVEFHEIIDPIDGSTRIEKYIPEWIVDTGRVAPQFDLSYGNREFMEWLSQKEKDIEQINKKLAAESSDIRVDGVYLYDIAPMVQGVYKSPDKVVDAITFYPRYAYIKTKWPRPKIVHPEVSDLL